MLKTIAAVLTVVAVAVLGFMWLYPPSQDMRLRQRISQVILGASAVRGEIAYRAREARTLAGVGRGLTIVPQGPVTGGEVSADGIIVVRGTVDDHPIEIGMKPLLKPDGQLEWRCRGLKVMEGWLIPDHAYMPRSCPRASAQDPF